MFVSTRLPEKATLSEVNTTNILCFGELPVTNPLAAHPSWRQLLVTSIALPVVVVAAVLAFAWPSARSQPRALPVGVVGSNPPTEQLIAGLNAAQPGGFDFHLYPDEDAARQAIEGREVYGAFVVRPPHLHVFEASAASPTVAQLLTSAGAMITAKATQQSTASGGPAVTETVTDVVALSKEDPRGAVFSSALLPLTICSILIASAIGIAIKFRPAWRQLVALVSVSAVAGAGVYLIAQGWLGALPHEAAETWASIGLTILAISSTTAGLIALVGFAGFALAAALMVFVGNPFAGVTSAPELLPDAVNHIGQWLPPGAGANLLRSTAYFGGNDAGGHLAVLITWIIAGFAAVVVGHHAPLRFAANAHRTSRLDPPSLRSSVR
jgi:hypothetical protein